MRFISPKAALVVLPLLHLFFSGLVFLPWRPFYTIGPDPVYIYLFSGTTIASGNLNICYIDNPGIPVQYFCGVVIWLRHLFNHSAPLYQDVLLHPESYIYALCMAGAILLGTFTWLTGYYVLRKTNRLSLALLFQMTPLIDTHGILVTGTPSPESFYIGAGMLFMAWLYCNAIIKNAQTNIQAGWKQLMIYGAFTAFLVSCKYLCFPLMFLVLFVLPSTRSRIKYLFSFFLFLAIFMCPALPAWRSIQSWFLNLATHTGHYGQGAKGFVNTSEYMPNLAAPFKEDFYFTAICLLLLISLLLAYVKRGKTDERSNPYIRALCGIAFSSCILILVVAKHYSFHYLMPVNLCYPLIIASAYHLFKDKVDLKSIQNKYIINTAFFIFLVIVIASQFKLIIDYPRRLRPASTAEFLDRYKNEPIIMGARFQSSRVEPALIIGTAYTGDYRDHYWEFLKRVYPYSYQYLYYPEPLITRWDEVLYMPELIAKYPNVVLYFAGEDSATRNATLHELTLWREDTIAHARLVYSFRETNEYVYELHGNPELADTLLHTYKEEDFDLEKLTQDGSKFISSDEKDTAQGASLLDHEEHHSGSNSIKMNWRNQHGLNYRIRSFPGQMIVVNVWRKASDGKGCIQLTSATGDVFTSGQTAIDSDASGWKQIQCKYLVPSSVKDSTICSSVYYYGHGTAYFDDLSVRVYSMKK